MDESEIENAVDAVMESVRYSAPYADGTPEDAMALFVGLVSEIMSEARALAESTGVEMPARFA